MTYKKKIPKKEDILKTKEDAEMIVVWLEELKKNKGWQVLLADLNSELEKRNQDLRKESLTNIAQLEILRGRINDLESLMDYPERRIKHLQKKKDIDFDVYEWALTGKIIKIAFPNQCFSRSTASNK